MILANSFGDEGVPAPSMLGTRALIAAEAGDLRYYINALHIALLTVGRGRSRALFLVAFVRKSVRFASLFVRKSVEFHSLFVRKSVINT